MANPQKSELVDILCTLYAETDSAILISDVGEKELAKWIPKSQVEIDRPDSADKTPDIIVTMPDWLAQEKEFI